MSEANEGSVDRQLLPDGKSYTPPCFTIDLSLPPEERYEEMTRLYIPQLRSLTSLFNDLLLDAAIPPSLLPTVNTLSRFVLRKVHNKDQTRELRGISRVTGIPMYLLVAFNVILDVLMGCTSGGVLSRERSQCQSSARMLHFRTLDWSMDPLRKIIVQLDFVKSASTTPGKVIATSITYAGFVGVLTGVRPGMSMSLNFRAVHNASTKKEQFQYYFHHLMVLLGRRPSISSVLRSYLLDGFQEDGLDNTDADRARENLVKKHTTAAYIIFSDGKTTHTIEKDFATAEISSSSTFVARTNHDIYAHRGPQDPAPAVSETTGGLLRYAGLQDFLDESCERLDCIADRWDNKVRYLRSRARGEARKTFTENDAYVTQAELIEWVSSYSTTNECTHFAAVMNPTTGKVVWCKAYPEPLGAADLYDG